MTKHIAASLAVLASWAGTAAYKAESTAEAGEHWFYMVRSEPAEPVREEEYNAWYDDIDIPDVLAVPGFLRARRAVALPLPESLDNIAGGRYVALYDIETDDIDKSIIDLYVAARKMSALGRLTDALKVTEANYYRRLHLGHGAAKRATAGEDRYLYIQKVICCNSVETKDQFLHWYRDIYTPTIGETDGLMRQSLYELYRIMEVLAVPPEEIPHLLIVHEFEGESAAEFLRRFDNAVGRLRTAGRLSDSYAPGEAVLYRQMSDVRSN